MSEPERYKSDWEGLHLVIEARSDRWQAYVYDPEACEVLYFGEAMDLDAAKFAAIDFVGTHLFGVHHDLNPAVIAQMLLWESK